jgi:hypothetical protein
LEQAVQAFSAESQIANPAAGGEKIESQKAAAPAFFRTR